MGWLRACLAVPAMLILLGCDEVAEAPPEDPPRAIKYVTLEERAGEQVRLIAGIVAPDVASQVAFETAGQVREILVSIGDRVEAGQVLARLDAEPFDLAIRSVTSELAQQRALLEDAEKKFEQQQQLFDRGFATRTAFDSARATLLGAQASVAAAETALNIAERDKLKAEMTAPFAGVIAAKLVEVFEEVSPGAPILTLQSEGQEKIELALPETMINQIAVGDESAVRFPTLPGAQGLAAITEIGAQTSAGAAYPVTLAMLTSPPGVRPGMSAEVAFSFRTEMTDNAFLLPIGAILGEPSSEGGPGKRYVFVFDEAAGAVRKREVATVNVRDNMLEIVSEEIQVGDKVAAAGVSFLADGMEVTLFDGQF
jgi:RND family efflux transporter MFP subunit